MLTDISKSKCSMAIFLDFLKCFYHQQITVTPENILDLLILSNTFQVDDIEQFCIYKENDGYY